MYILFLKKLYSKKNKYRLLLIYKNYIIKIIESSELYGKKIHIYNNDISPLKKSIFIKINN